jgi:hypothetical protein
LRLREVLLGLALLVAGVVAVGSVYPALDDLWVENPGWNGLSSFYNLTDPVRVRDLGELAGYDPVRCTLFLVGPSRGFTESDVEDIRGFLDMGGRVVLLDDFGSGNELLSGLGLETRFNGGVLRDGVFFDPVPEFPRLLNFSFYDVDELVLNYGSVLDLGERARVLISSTPLSYVNGSSGVVVGEFPVVAGVRVGDGLLVLVSDSSLWLNSMITRGDNRLFLGELHNGVSLIDVGHSYPTRLLGFQWMMEDLYAVLGLAEVRYLVGVLLVVLVFRLRFDEDTGEVVDEIDVVLMDHPDWSREKLDWLRERRG